MKTAAIDLKHAARSQTTILGSTTMTACSGLMHIDAPGSTTDARDVVATPAALQASSGRRRTARIRGIAVAIRPALDDPTVGLHLDAPELVGAFALTRWHSQSHLVFPRYAHSCI
ncbi:MAG TPA: hypothetical protein VMU33_15240 [Burkholderiaceae bacterium]|nr:hypothetical protein [Burkholderiaceae bacterium]